MSSSAEAQDHPEVSESSFDSVEELMRPAGQVPTSPVPIASVQPLLLPQERILPLSLRENPSLLGLEVYISRTEAGGRYILEVARDISKASSAQLLSIIYDSSEIVKVGATLMYYFYVGKMYWPDVNDYIRNPNKTPQITALMLKFASLTEMFDRNWEVAVNMVNEMLSIVVRIKSLSREHLYVLSAQECCNRMLNRMEEANIIQQKKEAMMRTMAFQEDEAVAAVLLSFNRV
jgi:hypothetical protein